MTSTLFALFKNLRGSSIAEYACYVVAHFDDRGALSRTREVEEKQREIVCAQLRF
jgi:hypothetical protein